MGKSAGSPAEAALRVEAVVRHGSSPWYGSVMIVTDLATGRRTRVDTRQPGPPVTEELDPDGPATPRPPVQQPTGTGPHASAAGATASGGRKVVTVEASGGIRHSFTVAGDNTLTVLVDDQPVLGVDELGPGYWRGDQWHRIPALGPELGGLPPGGMEAVRRQPTRPALSSHMVQAPVQGRARVPAGGPAADGGPRLTLHARHTARAGMAALR